MKKFIGQFAASDDGAVTVDWVVLTAAVMLLGVAIGATVTTSAQTGASNVGVALANNAAGGTTTP